ITLSFVYTVPKLTPASNKLNAINIGVFVPANIKMPHIVKRVKANIYKPFLDIFASNLFKLKFNTNQAKEMGKRTNQHCKKKSTNPLCNGDSSMSSCRYIGIYKLYPISIIAYKKSVVKTSMIVLLNSLTGKKGAATPFSFLINIIPIIIAIINERQFKYHRLLFITVNIKKKTNR